MSRPLPGHEPARSELRVDVARTAPPLAVVSVGGELDLATAPRLQERLEGLLAAGFCRLELDLGEVAFCDVAGLNMLLHTHALAVAAGGGLLVRGSCPPLRLMLRVLRPEGVFALASPVDAETPVVDGQA